MPDRLAEICARLDAATPSPGDVFDPYNRQTLAVEKFHAHAPADIAWLLDKVERLEAERGTLDESGATAR